MIKTTDFDTGVSDATSDLAAGWVPSGATPESVRAEFVGRFEASAEYFAGYFSVLFPNA